MLGGSSRHGAATLALVAVLALAMGACSGSTATPVPATPSVTPGAADTSVPSSNATGNGGTGVSGAGDNLAGASSYQFKVTLAGGQFGSLLSMLGDCGTSDSATFTVSGTVVTTPQAAADVTTACRHVIEIGGFDYLEQDDGSYTQTSVSGSGLVSGFSPQALYAGVIDTSADSGYTLVGTEQKNGVQADHYQASSAFLAEFGSIQGVANATWSGDIWISKDGGYPVSMALVARAADGSIAYELAFDLTKINDPSNKVTVPTNVTGA